MSAARFGPIAQPLSLSEAVYQAIEESIIKGRLQPGERLMLGELAESFNTSITPVREACARLEKEGLLTKEPNKGWKVRTLTATEVAELYETRAALESFAAKMCSQRIDDSGARELEALQEQGRRLLESADLDGYSRYNERLHSLIVDYAHNRTLRDMIGSMSHRVRLCMTRSVALRGRPEKAIGEHERLVSAIVNREPAKAASIMEDHILHALSDVVSALKAQEE